MADSDQTHDNEILAAAKDMKSATDRRSATDVNPPASSDSKRWPISTVAGIGAGIGIGSAALAAALMYARGNNRKKK